MSSYILAFFEHLSSNSEQESLLQAFVADSNEYVFCPPYDVHPSPAERLITTLRGLKRILYDYPECFLLVFSYEAPRFDPLFQVCQAYIQAWFRVCNQVLSPVYGLKHAKEIAQHGFHLLVNYSRHVRYKKQFGKYLLEHLYPVIVQDWCAYHPDWAEDLIIKDW